MEERGHRKTRTGIVVSDKMDKTVVVAIATHEKHRLYGKTYKKTTRLKAHDENNTCGVGDKVSSHGDPSSVQGQELARCGNYRKGQVRARKGGQRHDSTAN